jgi:hypothetical protein
MYMLRVRTSQYSLVSTTRREKSVRRLLHSHGEARAFVNGQWFTGEDFLRTTFYVLDGVLTAREPPRPVDTVDLQQGFVVPPFGDAHNHFPSREPDLADGNRAHLDAGVFYTLNPGGDAEAANPSGPNWAHQPQLILSSRMVC